MFSVLLGLSVAGMAQAKGGDPKAGKDKAALCAGCHGDDGNSMMADFPRLAGQYEAYIVKQVRDFKSGRRANNDTLAGMAQTVACVLFEKGNPLTGVYGCINCHGVRGKGKAKNISVFPRIGGQHRDYLIKELKDFRSGRRANDPAGMMAAIARKLSDDDITNVANYLSAQLP